jgi:hypothetical protein
MPSVACKIRSKKKPWWIEIDIGVDDATGDNFWRLTGKSTVTFPGFNSTVGRWDPIIYDSGGPSGLRVRDVPSIMLIAAEHDPFGGFVLFRPGAAFFRLNCGSVIKDEGAREDAADLTYRMDFLCV